MSGGDTSAYSVFAAKLWIRFLLLRPIVQCDLAKRSLQTGNPALDDVNMRLVEGLNAKDIEGFREKYSSQSSYEDATQREKEMKVEAFTGPLTKVEVTDIMKHRRSSLKVTVFVDGHAGGEVDSWSLKVATAAEKSEKCKHWSVIHAPCNPGMVEAFGLGADVLPTVVAWSPKALRYVKRVGRQDPESLAGWADEVAAGKVRGVPKRDTLVS